MFKKNLDQLQREFEYLRISVTDKCNFRCRYCMPKENFGRDYEFLRRSELLSFEEIIRVITVLEQLGLKKVKLTGGEPLLRKNIEKLIEGINLNSEVNEISMTTNGSLLNKDTILKLKDNGLNKITLSLDSILKSTFKKLSDSNTNFSKINGLSNEVIEKLSKSQPSTLGQASRLEGVTPAAVNVIAINIKKIKKAKVKNY